MCNEDVSINDVNVVKDDIMDTLNKTSDEVKENMLDAGKALVDGNNEQANFEIEEALKDTIDGTEEIVSDMTNLEIAKIVNLIGEGMMGEIFEDTAKEAVEEATETGTSVADKETVTDKNVEMLETLKLIAQNGSEQNAKLSAIADASEAGVAVNKKILSTASV
jgi:hypothetical protein